MFTKKMLAVFVLTLFFLSGAGAQDLFYSSNMRVSLNKQVFESGETLEAEITVLNMEDFPVAEAYLVIELVQGKDYYYPSQTSDVDNVFFEEKITGLNLAPNSKVTVAFSHVLPADLKPGDYRLDAYAKTVKTHLVGAPHIFASPKTVRFKVETGSGQFPEAKFGRTETRFHQFTGPVGPGIEPNSNIENDVFVQNVSDKDLRNLSLFVGLCEWDDTSCASFDSSATTNIDLLKAGEQKGVSVNLKASEMPDAYAIRLELRDSGGKLLSLYRNRSVVYGPTAKIHQLNVSDYIFKKGDEAELSLLIGPSPDHYLYPTFTDFTLKTWVENIRDNNSIVFEQSKQIDSITVPDLKTENFSFTSSTALDLFKVCALIEKQGIEHENYCYIVDASKFPSKEEKSELELEWDYDFSARTLDLVFSNKDTEVNEINAAFLLMDFATNDLVSSKSLEGKSPTTEKIEVEPSNFVLLLNNFSTGKQTRIEINLAGQLNAPSLQACAELGGTICSSDTRCENIAASSDSGICCLTECKGKPAVQEGVFPGFSPILIFIFLVLLVLAIVGVSIFYFGKEQRKRKVVGEIIEKIRKKDQ